MAISEQDLACCDIIRVTIVLVVYYVSWLLFWMIIPLPLAFLITLWSLYDGFMFIIMWVRDRRKQKQQTAVEVQPNPNADEESNPNTDA